MWGSYEPAVVVDSGAGSNLMEDNGARSNPQARVELARLADLCCRLRGEAAVHPRSPRSAPAKMIPVLETVTRVLELAEQPMRARDVHAAGEELLCRPIKWTSVKATLARHACGQRPRFQRTSYGRYRIA
jgi:hypothetical protein